MKYFSYITLLVFITSCAPQSDKSVFFENLPGNWQRTNEEAGKSTFEHWEKTAGDQYTGMAFTLQEKDTIFKENLRIYKKNTTWNLEVTAPSEKPVTFKVTEQKTDGFTAESPQNEYPKKVEYSLKNDQLTAKISGGGPEIVFDFEKMND